MNDTMKLALGVTGFASLLVLAVPSNFDVSDEQQEQAPPKAAPEKKPTPQTKNQVIIEDDEDEDFSFGDPIASTDPINFDEFDKDTSPSNTKGAVKVKPSVKNQVRNRTNPGQSFGTPAGPVQAAVGQPLSSPISQGSPKPLPPQGPRKTIGTGGKPVNSGGVNISSVPKID